MTPTPQPNDTGEAIRKENMTDTTDTEIDRILYQFRNNWRSAIDQRLPTEAQKAAAEARAAIQELVRAELNNLITDIQNPYPEDVFSELDPDEYPKIDEFARTRGYRIDRISGTLIRRGWLVYKHQLEKEVDERFDALSSNQKEGTE